MLAYIVRRLLQGLVVLFIVVFFTFSLSYLQPHGAYAPAYIACGVHVTPSCLSYHIKLYGLDQGFFVRLWQYFWGIITRLDLGYSYKQNATVRSELSVFIPRTFWLGFFSLFLATIVAIPVGIYQAWKRNHAFDYVATGVAFVMYAIPTFVLGFVLFDLLCLNGPGLPTPSNDVDPWAIFKYPDQFIVPIMTLTLVTLAIFTRYMRSEVLDVLVQDYVRMARAKGCSTWGILFRHTVRNAMGPIVVILGLSVPALLSGALIVESLFNYQGLGYATITAATNSDIYTILGITVVVTIATILGNIVADVGLAAINPRVRIEGRR